MTNMTNITNNTSTHTSYNNLHIDNDFNIDAIMSKCKYIADKHTFDYIEDIWKNKFGALYHNLSETTSMMTLKEES